MILSVEQAQAYTGETGQQAFVELGFDSMFYLKQIKDPTTGQTATVLYSGLGMAAAYYRTPEEALGTAMQNGLEVYSLH